MTREEYRAAWRYLRTLRTFLRAKRIKSEVEELMERLMGAPDDQLQRRQDIVEQSRRLKLRCTPRMMRLYGSGFGANRTSK